MPPNYRAAPRCGTCQHHDPMALMVYRADSPCVCKKHDTQTRLDFLCDDYAEEGDAQSHEQSLEQPKCNCRFRGIGRETSAFVVRCPIHGDGMPE